MKNRYCITSLISVIILSAASNILAESNSGVSNNQLFNTESKYTEESFPFSELDIPDDVRKRFAALDTLPPPILLNTQVYFDWRLMGGVTPAKNQLPCGSCWDFAATGAFESALLINDGVLWDLSEQQVLSCNAEGYNCDGGWMDGVWNLFMGYGAIEESDMPYQADDNIPCTQENYVPVAHLIGFEDIPDNINAIKNALMTGPVTTAYLHSQDFQYNCYWRDPSNYLNHFVMIVGWDDTMCSGHGAWIVKNSIGPEHGDNGFDYIPYNSCGIGSYSQRPIYQSGIPELFYSPDSISIDVPRNEIVTQSVDIYNLGDANLYYFLRPAPPIEQDSFGYYWFQSDSLVGPDYEWLDISSTGQLIDFGSNIDDGNSGPLNLGFDFIYYGNLFNSINVCTNGWASFTDGSSTQNYSLTLPNPEPPNNLLTPLFYNLSFEHGGEAYFYTNNTDSAIITWQNVPDVGQGGPFTFQMILVAPNYIKFQYDEVVEGGFEAWTVGIENNDGTIGLDVNRFSPYIRDEIAVEFNWAPLPGPLDWISVDSALGTVPPINSNPVEVTFEAENLDLGDYSATLLLACNDLHNRTNIIPVTMSVVEPTNVVENNEISPKYLSSNKSSPNPFNTTTIIKYNLKIASEIKVEIYNILGRKVETIIEGEKTSGEHQISWDAEDQPSGVYFYRIKAGDYSETKKMVKLK